MNVETENISGVNDESSQEEITILSSFKCDSCGIGSEKYHEVFCDGSCGNCGAPVKEFEATITEVGLDLLNKSILILSHVEVDDQVNQMIEVLSENGIYAIKSVDIIENTTADQVVENLAFVSRNVAFTFVVSSENIDSDKATNVLLSDLLFGDHGKESRVIPVYIDEKSFQNRQMFMIDRKGINWNGLEESSHYSSRERSIEFLKAELRVNE